MCASLNDNRFQSADNSRENIGDANHGSNHQGALSIPSNDAQHSEIEDQGNGETNSLAASLNQLTLSQKNIEQVSKHFAQSQRCEGDLDDDVFDLKSGQFLSCLQLSPAEIDALEKRTIGQIKIDEWHVERRKRLIATTFGIVFHSRDHIYKNNLVTNLLLPTPQQLLVSRGEYRLKVQREAVTEYEKVIKEQSVKPCGLFVHPQFGYLCASPDGLVGDDGIVKIICPSSARRLYLKTVDCESSDGQTSMLHTNDDYFYQIQGQLEITGREWCDFVVWTAEKGIEHMERINRDKSVWERILPKLVRFYRLSLLPELVDPRIPRGLPIREPSFVLKAKNAKEIERENNKKLSLSRRNYLDQLVLNFEELSKNYTKSKIYLSDMGEDQFNLACKQFLNSLQLSSSAIDALQKQTIERVKNNVWKKEIWKRLTASNFGPVYHLWSSTSRRRLVINQLNPRGGRYSKTARKHGLNNETKAIKAYQTATNQIVQPCGMFVHPQFGYLSASPDGLVGDDGLVEVKCPTVYELRYLKLNGGNRSLRKTDYYFYQIQGQLEITGREWCDFVVWTAQKGIVHMERINRDKSLWEAMLPKLEAFYKLSLLPEIVDSRIVRRLAIREPDFVVEARNAAKKKQENSEIQPK